MLTIGLSTLLLWLVVIGWNPARLIQGHDTLASFPMLQDLMASHGNWKDFLFRPHLEGGVVTHIGFAIAWYQWMGYWGLEAFETQNFLVFFLQILLSFLSWSIIQSWRRRDGPGEGTSFNILEILSVTLLVGFSPILGWQLGHGHEYLILGTLPFLSFMALFISSVTGTTSLTLFILACAAMINGFSSAGFQAVANSVVFGLPLFLGLIWELRKKNLKAKHFIFPTLVALASIGICLPRLVGIFAHSLGSDTIRSLSGSTYTYSYVTARAQDWLSSIPWALDTVPIGRNPLIWHEVNYPLGPLLLVFLFGLKFWKGRLPGLVAGLGVGMILAILFSANFSPLSNFLLTIFPVLKSFRVPERSVLPCVLMLPTIFFMGFPSLKMPRGGRNLFITALVLMGVYFSPPLLREVLAWALALSLLFSPWRLPLFLALGFCSILAFQERLLPPTSREDLVTKTQEIRKFILDARPDLINSLHRIKILNPWSSFKANTAYGLGLSTPDGYFFSTTRFFKLYEVALGEPLSVGWSSFYLDNEDGIKVMNQLYNVKYYVKLGDHDAQIMNLKESPGAAWFSQTINWVPDFKILFQKLLENAEAMPQFLRENVWLISTDPDVDFRVAGTVDRTQCLKGRVLNLEAQPYTQSVRIQVESPAQCLLSVSLNYSNILEALNFTTPSEKFVTLPVYGSLLGIIVPPGTHDIEVRPKLILPFGAQIGFYIGLLFLILCPWLFISGFRRSRVE